MTGPLPAIFCPPRTCSARDPIKLSANPAMAHNLARPPWLSMGRGS